MAFKFDFKTLWLASLLLGLGCDQDTAPPGSPDAEQDSGRRRDEDRHKDAGTEDAGKDVGSDAGEKDAGNAEPAVDASVDAGAKESDAGATDAGAAKPDAGHAMSGGDAGPHGSACEHLTYHHFGKMFIDTYCIGCHISQFPQLGTLDAIVTNKNRIQSQVAIYKAMPPPDRSTPKPDDHERMKLVQWLECGPK